MAIYVESGRITSISGNTNDASLPTGWLPATGTPDYFVVIQGRGTDTANEGPRDWAIRCVGQPDGVDDTLRFQNETAAGEATWWAVKCDEGEFTSQKYNGSITGIGVTTSTETLTTPVDPTRTMLIISRRTGTTTAMLDPKDAARASYVKAYFGTPNTAGLVEQITVEIDNVINVGSGSANYTLFVVEWSEASGVLVDQQAFGDTNIQATESTVDVSSGFGVASDRTAVIADFNHTLNHLEGCSVRTTMDYSAGQFNMRRESPTVSMDSSGVLQAVTFPVGGGVSVAYCEDTFLATDSTKELTLSQEVHAASSIVFMTNSQDGQGEGFCSHLFTCELTSVGTDGMTDKITIDRDYTLQEGRVGIFVIDFQNADLVGAAQDDSAILMSLAL